MPPFCCENNLAGEICSKWFKKQEKSLTAFIVIRNISSVPKGTVER